MEIVEKKFNCLIIYANNREIIIKEINLHEQNLKEILDLLCEKYELYYTELPEGNIEIKDQNQSFTKKYTMKVMANSTGEVTQMLNDFLNSIDDRYIYLDQSNILSVHTTYKKHKQLEVIIEEINKKNKNFLLNFHIVTIIHEKKDTSFILRLIKSLKVQSVNFWRTNENNSGDFIIKALNNYIKTRDRNSVSHQVTTHSLQIRTNSKFRTEIQKKASNHLPDQIMYQMKNLPATTFNHLTNIEGVLSYNTHLSLELSIRNINSLLNTEDLIKSDLLLNINDFNYIGAITGEIKFRKAHSGFLRFFLKKKADEKTSNLQYHFLFYVTVSDICDDKNLINTHKQEQG